MGVLYRTAIAIAVSTGISLFGLQSISSADSSLESITLSPASKTYKVDPGQTFDDSLTVLNDGNTAYDFIVYASPYSVESGSYDKPNYTETTVRSDAYTWVSFPKTTWRIEAHQTLKIPFAVNVKKNASPGGHYGVLFVEIQPKESSSGDTTLTRKKRVGTVIYATVSGDVNLKGQIVDVDIPWFQSRAPVNVTSSVQNLGNSDFVTKVTYEASDVFGTLKFRTEGEYVVLPSTTRDIVMSWDKATWFGLFKVRVTTAFLETTNMKEVYVLVMPIWLVLITGVTIISGGIYAIWRHFYRTKH